MHHLKSDQFYFMNVMVLGSGGREHAFAYAISKSSLLSKLYIAPGNPGTAQCGINVDIASNNFEKLSNFLAQNHVNLLVVGPEQPLVEGIRDYLEKDSRLAELKIIGPGKQGAQLEGSKSFSKTFMEKHDIPTAKYKEVTDQNIEEGEAFIDEQTLPIVLKADGLAAGKGVLIVNSKAEAKIELNNILNGKFGTAGNKVIIEEYLQGLEFSIFVLTDGNTYKVLPIAKDYKRIGEADTGLNTGGMGAVSPVPVVAGKLMFQIVENIIEPTIKGLQKDEIPYQGFIYFGLMSTQNGPYVLEYNIRLGDPETQVVLPRIESDFLELLASCGNGTLDAQRIKTNEGFAVTVVCASEGYPQTYEKGKTIEGLNEVTNSIVFQAGTIKENEQIKTNGGRVLAVTSLGSTLQEALSTSYQSINQLCFEGIYYRKDIGYEFKDNVVF